MMPRLGFVVALLFALSLIAPPPARTEEEADARSVQPFPIPQYPTAPASSDGHRVPRRLLDLQASEAGPGLRVTTRFAFFPPLAPALGSPVADLTMRAQHNGQSLEAPEELAGEVGENYYAPLGTRLHEGKLSVALAKRWATLRATRTALFLELCDEIATSRLADPASREAYLRAFAATQTPRITAWERQAEELRADLVDGGFVVHSFDWNEKRTWRLRETSFPTPQMERLAEQLVLRAAAYYQNGLGPEQRWLLREMALELSRPVLTMFFSPGTAHLSLPAKVPAELSAKIARYNGDREALKSELRTAIATADSRSNRARTALLSDLTERQRPRLAALEDHAEEIRRDLAKLPPPPLPKLPPLPKALRTDIEAHQKEVMALRAELRAQLPPPGSSTRSSEEKRAGAGRSDKLASDLDEWSATRMRIIEEFKNTHAERYEALQRRAAALRRELDDFGRSIIDPATGRPMDAAAVMRYYRAAILEFEALGRREVIYNDYETAVLEPGLSVEQRRLLFSAALGRLSQSLPPGRRMPNGEPLPTPAF